MKLEKEIMIKISQNNNRNLMISNNMMIMCINKKTLKI